MQTCSQNTHTPILLSTTKFLVRFSRSKRCVTCNFQHAEEQVLDSAQEISNTWQLQNINAVLVLQRYGQFEN